MYNDYLFFNKKIIYEINEVNILLELKRFLLIKNIKKESAHFFIQHNFNPKILNNILPRWIMLQLSNKTELVDPLLPFNGNNNIQLIKDLYYLTDKKLSYETINDTINKLNLKKKFNDSIINIKHFIDSDFYKKNKNNIIVKITYKNNFYYFTMDIKIRDIEFAKLKYLNFKLNKNILEKLLYNSNNILDKENINNIMCIILRYNTLESYNQQSAVLPKFYNFLNQQYKINFELFSSSINFSFNNYCTLFYDIESKYGSLGNFNNIILKRGFYVANPPFDETIMNNMSNKLIYFLNNSSEPLSIFITLPAWDKIEYGEFYALELLKKSPYITYIEKLNKERILFFDYHKNEYYNLTDAYFILIQNDNGKIQHPISNILKNIILDFFPKI